MATAGIDRRTMVETQLIARGIRDREVLAAMGEVERERFVSSDLASEAYRDSPLPIAQAQTISQPYIVALMLEAARLKPTDRVLDVGTGSGYAAAVLSRIVREVYTIERHPLLSEKARAVLASLGYKNVELCVGDGSRGWPEHGPYDAIVVAAFATTVPQALLAQLVVGGRLVVPIGNASSQELVRVVRTGPASFEREELGGVRFVPLVEAS